VLHVHDLDHVQVDGALGGAHTQACVRHDVCQLIRQLLAQLGRLPSVGEPNVIDASEAAEPASPPPPQRWEVARPRK
jgi:hypothetical protein